PGGAAGRNMRLPIAAHLVDVDDADLQAFSKGKGVLDGAGEDRDIMLISFGHDHLLAFRLSDVRRNQPP
ncbi:hypothetical protein, partial [Mesorhizobium sp. M7A.F.Ca.CA.001.12.1.1]|uniref:hypothetical protein n=1 Tax=Mesorhizobium sp. M7A.F.Ca.CA.001.12.1.1 TaxID=2496724 RepID=UPI0013DEFDE8